MTITVLYTCDSCGVKDAEVQVPERGPNEDVVRWLEQKAAGAISVHHRQVSPLCRASKMTHVKIPLPQSGEGIGYPTKQ